MGLGSGEKALEMFLGLKRTCQQFNGDLTLLWHNSRLVEVGERRLMSSLKQITVQGYKSIQSLENLALKPLNILIGANGAGKRS
jgi:hypothetical protein